MPFFSGKAALAPCQPHDAMLFHGMMKTSLPRTLFAASAALLAACSPTPSDRIANNMPAYEQLPREQQVKVARGELEKGMSPMAVLLAWESPNRR